MQNPTRQKRQSCEACRTRKLKCSGYTGERRSCTRCLALNVVCHYQDKGIPGRPRKQRGDLREESSRASRGPREARELSEARRFAFAPSPPVTDSSSARSIDGSNDEGQSHPPLQTAAAHQTHRLGVDSLFLQPLSFPLFPPSNDALPTTLPDPSSSSADFAFDPFPIELFGQCPLVRHHHGDEETPTATLSPPQSPHSSPQSPATLSCHCADDVSASVRALRHRAQAVSHAIVADLRVGIDLVERLLTCPICYDIKKAPRLTIENVLLIGRLMHEVNAGYRRYVRWVGSITSGGDSESSEDRGHGGPKDTVLVGGAAFEVDRRMVQAVVRQGLQADAARLTDLGGRFALRQHNRHMVGHETCPDPDGRCWRERYDMDTDPLDICPQNAAARTLTPCYRVVDAICLGIKAFADDVNGPDTAA